MLERRCSYLFQKSGVSSIESFTLFIPNHGKGHLDFAHWLQFDNPSSGAHCQVDSATPFLKTSMDWSDLTVTTSRWNAASTNPYAAIMHTTLFSCDKDWYETPRSSATRNPRTCALLTENSRAVETNLFSQLHFGHKWQPSQSAVQSRNDCCNK